jgi:DNA-binding PadR family transcriptional regulator
MLRSHGFIESVTVKDSNETWTGVSVTDSGQAWVTANRRRVGKLLSDLRSAEQNQKGSAEEDIPF